MSIRLSLVMASFALGCSSDPAPPDAGPDAQACIADVSYDRCELINQSPPGCYLDPCEGDDERICGNTRLCQEWDDCKTGTCFQCRYLIWCECRTRC
jgi:hypothetical protein